MIPLRITDYKLSNKWPKHIILHHTAEKPVSGYDFKYDSPKSQIGDFTKLLYTVNNTRATGYNFIIEKIKKDYEVVVSQPLMSLCVWDDLDEIYHKDVHIAFMGDFDSDILPIRAYKVLSLRLLVPLMRTFYINESDILFHNAISYDDITCPGEFINMAVLKVNLKTFMRKKSVSRG